MIVVPAVDIREGRCVRLTRGHAAAETVYGDDPVEMARRFEAEGAELLHVVDLDAAMGSRSNREVVETICAVTSIPVQAGGGLRSPDAVEGVLAAGASRAVLGTAAALDPGFVRDMASRFGDAVVVAVDVLEGEVMVGGWREPAGPMDDLLPALDEAGAPRFLVTAIAADGTLEGPDIELYRRVLAATRRPVLASGGVRNLDDVMALAELGVEGAIVGKALYEGTLTLADALEAVS